MTQVYVIGTNVGIVKIGVAIDPQKRLHILQSLIRNKGRPDISLTLLHSENVGYPWSSVNIEKRVLDTEYKKDMAYAKDVERAAHANLVSQRLPYAWFATNGLRNTNDLAITEWFRATDDEAYYAVKAGVIEPLPPAARTPAVPTARFADLFGIPLPAHLEACQR